MLLITIYRVWNFSREIIVLCYKSFLSSDKNLKIYNLRQNKDFIMRELSLIYILKLPNAFHEKSCFLLFPIFLSFNHLMWKFLCFLAVSGWAVWENKPEKWASSGSKLETDTFVKCKMFLFFFKYYLDGEEWVGERESKTMLNTREIWKLDLFPMYTCSTCAIQQIDENLIFPTEIFDYYTENIFHSETTYVGNSWLIYPDSFF